MEGNAVGEARSREWAWGRSALGQPAATRPGALTPARARSRTWLHVLLLGLGGQAGKRADRRAESAAPGGCMVTGTHCSTPLPTHTPHAVFGVFLVVRLYFLGEERGKEKQRKNQSSFFSLSVAHKTPRNAV